MSIDLRFYHAVDRDLGGAINTGDPFGSILAVGHQSAPSTELPSMTSEATGGPTNHWYHKFFVRNQSGGIVYDPTIYMGNLSDPLEVSIARAKAAGDSTVAIGTMPSGYSSSDFVSFGGPEDAIPVMADTSDITNNQSQGFWLRFRIQPGQLSEQSVGSIFVRGRTTP